MDKYQPHTVANCYNLVAEEYARLLFNELDGKPFDCHMLDRFAGLVEPQAIVYDIGCGPGEIAHYLYKNHKLNVRGLDFSEKMVEVASRYSPEIKFVKGDMLNLNLANSSIGAIAAFYAIVHFTFKEVETAIDEFLRVLNQNGLALISFHIGKESLTVDNYMGFEGASATWMSFEPDEIVEILSRKNNCVIEDIIIRYPYIGKEYPSKRCYILFRKS